MILYFSSFLIVFSIVIEMDRKELERWKGISSSPSPRAFKEMQAIGNRADVSHPLPQSSDINSEPQIPN
jgi:hypothetical protein